MTDSAELKQRLEGGIKELEADIAKLRAAITALEGNDAQPRASRRRKRRSGRTTTDHEVVPAGKISALLERTDGLRTAEVASQTSGAVDQVLRLLKELEQAGSAHRTGTRRATRWHVGAKPERPTRPAAASEAAKSTREPELPAAGGEGSAAAVTSS